ncbi:MAG: hypothetical protein E6J70_01925 [Deltaproteobacteria bacterium]|nr:MAG: hypothetical protein E6J70_01925 [Deltaproteobacteria bacterium]
MRAPSAANDHETQAARLRGISRRTLWCQLERYGL